MTTELSSDLGSLLVEGDKMDAVIGVTTERAAKLAGLSVKKLATWERIGLVVPEVTRIVNGRRSRVFSLGNLVELRVARQLEEKGVSVRTIRRVVEAHRNSTSSRPLSELRWGTADKQVYVGFDDDTWVGGRRPLQGVLVETIDLEEIRAALTEAVRARDHHDIGRVERRSRALGRKAVLAGTRTPVAAVRAYLDRGLPDSEVLAAFPHLTPSDIEAARRRPA